VFALLASVIEDDSGLDPSFVRRLFDGEKRASDLTIIRLALALIVDPELVQQYPAHVPFVLNKLKNAQLSDAIAQLDQSRARKR
jgi:hypothetical protein